MNIKKDHLSRITSQLFDKKLKRLMYPLDPLDNILNSRKISFSVKFLFSSRMVRFSMRSILAACIGQPTRHFSK